MNREDIQKLLGGYATNTLTPEEQQALFAAALEDQDLFDQLAREQSLRDLLTDPSSRAHLLAALDAPAPIAWYRRWWMPLSAAAVAVTIASVAIVAVRYQSTDKQPVTVARVEKAVPPAVTSEVPAPPEPAPKEVVKRESPPASRRDEPRATNAQPAATSETAANKRLALADKQIAQSAAAPPPPLPPPAAAPAPIMAGAGVVRPAAPALAAADAVAKDKESGEKLEAAAATTRSNQVSAGAEVAPLPKPANKLDEARQLPAQGFRAAAVAAEADLKKAAATPDARALFYGSTAAAGSAGGGAGRGGRGGGGGGSISTLGAIGGQAGAANAKNATAAPANTAHLGIQYLVLSQTADGAFADSGATVASSVVAGAPFKLQFIANEAGYIRLLQEGADGVWRQIANRAVARLQSVDTEPIQVAQAGRVKFYLTFARQPLPPSGVPQPDDDIVVDRSAVITVAGRNPSAQLGFNIMLTVQ
jgi:hypothetical protein